MNDSGGNRIFASNQEVQVVSLMDGIIKASVNVGDGGNPWGLLITT